MVTSGSRDTVLEKLFPNLQDSPYRVTSPKATDYNCIAWAAGFGDRWMWPDSTEDDYWPNEVAREATITAFIAAFAALGFEICDSEELEPGREKVAIYASHDLPKHAARQLPDGSWTSKCGNLEDITHSLNALEGIRYGKVTVILSRSNPNEST